MRSFIALATVLTLTVPALSQEHGLADLRGTARPLLIFAQPGTPLLEEQRRLLRLDTPGLRQRDVIIVLPPELDFVTDEGGMQTTHFSHAEDQALRQRFRISPGQFTIVLVGKDGEEKLRSNTPLGTEKLCQTIDAMPMRKDEMHHR